MFVTGGSSKSDLVWSSVTAVKMRGALLHQSVPAASVLLALGYWESEVKKGVWTDVQAGSCDMADKPKWRQEPFVPAMVNQRCGFMLMIFELKWVIADEGIVFPKIYILKLVTLMSFSFLTLSLYGMKPKMQILGRMSKLHHLFS